MVTEALTALDDLAVGAEVIVIDPVTRSTHRATKLPGVVEGLAQVMTGTGRIISYRRDTLVRPLDVEAARAAADERRNSISTTTEDPAS